MGMTYEDLRTAKCLINLVAINTGNMPYATTKNELHEYQEHALHALNELTRLCNKCVDETAKCCASCHYLRDNNGEWQYCTACGVSIHNKYIHCCELYESEMPARKGEVAHEVY